MQFTATITTATTATAAALALAKALQGSLALNPESRNAGRALLETANDKANEETTMEQLEELESIVEKMNAEELQARLQATAEKFQSFRPDTSPQLRLPGTQVPVVEADTEATTEDGPKVRRVSCAAPEQVEMDLTNDRGMTPDQEAAFQSFLEKRMNWAAQASNPEVDPQIEKAVEEMAKEMAKETAKNKKTTRKLRKIQSSNLNNRVKQVREQAARLGLELASMIMLARKSEDFRISMEEKKATRKEARELQELIDRSGLIAKSAPANRFHEVEDPEVWESIDWEQLHELSNNELNSLLRAMEVAAKATLNTELEGKNDLNLGEVESSLAYLEVRYDRQNVSQFYQELTNEIERIEFSVNGYAPEMIATWLKDGAVEVITRAYARFGGERELKGWWPSLSQAQRDRRDEEENYAFPIEQLEKDWARERPTWIEATSEGAYALWIVGANGKVLPFGDLGGYELVSSKRKTNDEGETVYVLGDKVFKRESVKRMGSYLRDRVRVAEYGSPQAASPETFVYRLMPEAGLDHDGVVYISRRLRDHLVARMVERMLDGREWADLSAREAEKLSGLAKKALKSISFGNFRMLSEIGLFKGDALVVLAESAAMPKGVDILVYRDNLKEEIRYVHPGGYEVGIVSMDTKGQGKEVRSNRQVISFLRDLGYGEDYKEIIDAFKRQMNLNVIQLKEGTYNDARALDMEPGQDGYVPSFSAIAEMVATWKAEGLNPADSAYLTGMLAQGIAMANTPDDREQDRKRRFPVPNGVGSSMHTYAGYELVYGRKCPVGPYEVLFDPGMGWIPGKAIEHLFFGIQGGADRDDRTDAICGFADADSVFRSPDGKVMWDVKKGRTVGLFYRNPLTANSDGENTSFEFLIAHIVGLEVLEDEDGNRAIVSPMDSGKVFTQTIPVSRRPLCVAEMETPQASFEATPIEMPEFLNRAEAWKLIKANRRDPLGRFMNLLMCYAAMGWSWQHVAAGEEVVDACQQLRNPEDFKELESLITALQDAFLGRLLATRTPIDYWVAKRAGGKVLKAANREGLVVDGVFSTLVKTHRGIVEEFKAETAGMARAIRKRIVEGEKEDRIPRAAEIMQYWQSEILRPANLVFEEETGKKYNGKDMAEWKRQILGDALAARVEQVAERLGREKALKLVSAVYDLLQIIDGKNREYAAKYMYWGQMLPWTIAALKEYPSKGTGRGNGGGGGGGSTPPSSPPPPAPPEAEHDEVPSDMLDEEYDPGYEIAKTPTKVTCSFAEGCDAAPLSESVLCGRHEEQAYEELGKEVCKRRNCSNPRQGTQFCVEHECPASGCSNAPQKGELMCGPHTEQAERAHAATQQATRKSTSPAPATKTTKKEDEKNIAVIGQRPKHLGGYDADLSHLVDEVVEQLSGLQQLFPNHKLVELCGGAQGGDWIGEEAARRVGMPVHVFQAFEGVDSKWPWPARKKFQELLARAEQVTLVTEGDCSSYDDAVAALMRRNRAMIAQADVVIAIWNENPRGGTYSAIMEARRLNKPVIILQTNSKAELLAVKGEVNAPVPGCPQLEDLERLPVCPQLPLVAGNGSAEGFAETGEHATHVHFYRGPEQEVLEQVYQSDPEAFKHVKTWSTQRDLPPMPKLWNKNAGAVPADAVYIGRGSKWGNPFTHRRDVAEKHNGKVMLVGSREEAVERYAKYLDSNTELKSALSELHGKDLACFCSPDRCHGDVLIVRANPEYF